MLPTLVDRQLTQGLKSHLESQFPMATPHFAGLWDAFFTADAPVVKGPYLQLSLPFRKVDASASRRFAPAIADIGFTPYLHQQRAFDRLCGASPASTIIATGTGSGKTECFLLPVLEHCVQHKHERGIRAIFVYPMNALATDQAMRIAKVIAKHAGLSGLRVGLYIGEDQGQSKAGSQREKEMGAEHVITDRTALREHPPQILLTNYKMLDYLLIRPEDAALWQDNGNGELRCLAVDELHTYDGAQAADLACLIRRVKDRLRLETGRLCCVGTSATLGDGDSALEILDYAKAVFGEDFAPDALIGEDRLTAAEFLPHDDGSSLPLAATAEYLPTALDNEEEYLRRQLGLWGFAVGGPDLALFRALNNGKTPADRRRTDELGRRLLGVSFAAAFISRCAGHVPLLRSLSAAMSRNLFDDEEPAHVDQVEAAIRSLTALLSRIRQVCDRSYDYPDVRIQYWTREMARMVASIRPASGALAFADDLSDASTLSDKGLGEAGDTFTRYLPLANCRTCGCAGWISVYSAKDRSMISVLEEIYRQFFAKGSDALRYIVPLSEGETPRHLNGDIRRLCASCLGLASDGDTTCPECSGTTLVRVAVQKPKMENHTNREGEIYTVGRRICPICGADDGGILLIGMRTATLCSHLVATLNGSIFNYDKKIIAFNDNVQDASHRASFFSARTWSSTFRSQLAHTLHDNVLPDTPLPDFLKFFLDDLSQRFPDAGRRLATFTPQDCKWWQDWLALEQHGTAPSAQTLGWLALRLRWETCMEFGFKSNIGRTLEKTGVAAAYVKLPELSDACWQELLTPLQNTFVPLRSVTVPTLRACVAALTDTMLRHGAVQDDKVVPAILWGAQLGVLRWQMPFKMALQGMSRGGSHPVFPGRATTGGTPELVLPLTPGGKLNTLFKTYTGCDDAMALEALLDALDAKGILKKALSGPQARVAMAYWVLPQESVMISCNLVTMRCPTCGRIRHVPRAVLSAADSAVPCRGSGCSGILSPASIPPHHYRQQYIAGDVFRLVCTEHTGLLKRDERETIEKRFKDPVSKAWYPNLLSATPTLEMGIDIGDLSTVLLCSVPPTQSSYVQRVGRSGRKTGSAINVTVANARPHDLYFFLTPEEMMAGGVRAPGVYLDAVSVLQRQFLGFALAEWIVRNSQAAYPRDIGAMLRALSRGAPVFPNTFLTWYETECQALVSRFATSLGTHASMATTAGLKDFACGKTADGLAEKLRTEVAALRAMLQGYESKAQGITAQIQAVKADVGLTQEAREAKCAELEKERGAFRTLLRRLRKETVWGWLCDMASLLPNYAFPEEGVGLQTILYREVTGAGGAQAQTKVEFDIKRPASSALRELAPGMEFYAYGHHVPIGAIDMAQTEAPQRWRFCPACDALSIDESTLPPLCPQCQSDWSDVGQVRTLLRPRQFITVDSERKTLTDDSSEQRIPKWHDCKAFFEKRTPVTASFHSPDDADLPFGFEYIEHLLMREINFGEKALNNDAGGTVNGESIWGKGFPICTTCGRVQLDDETVHAPWCDATTKENSTVEFVNHQLYREYNTEALRLFIPVLLTGDEQITSLTAAIKLGLERHFHGKVDHLHITEQTLPIPGSTLRQHFLVIYDAVPGGTGYLRQFVQGDGTLLFDVFDKANTVLKGCVCGNDTKKDGCYRCLYRYQNQSERNRISRRSAMAILDQLSRLRGRMIFEQRELSVTDYLAGLLESELERAFVQQLAARVKAAGGTCEPAVVQGLRKGLMLRLRSPDSPVDRVWACVFQEELGADRGVLCPCRPDVVIYPQDSATMEAKPVAIFLDGWEFHKDTVGDDLRKRISLLDAGFRVWSLAWSDVDPASAVEIPGWMRNLAVPSGSAVEKRRMLFAHYRGATSLRNPDKPQEEPSHFWNEWLVAERGIDRLLTYLRLADDPLFMAHAQCEACCLGKYVASASTLRPEIPKDQDAFLAAVPAGAPLARLDAGRNAAAVYVWRDATAPAEVAMRYSCCYDDSPPNDAQADWKAFFAFFNLFQFLPPAAGLFFSTSVMIDPFWEERSRSKRHAEQGAWELLLANFPETDDPSRLMVLALQSVGVTEVPTAFEDIVRETDEEVIGFGQLVWMDRKIAWLDAPTAGAQAMRADGWLVGVSGEDAPHDFAQQVQKLCRA